jgi:hypothetical protein
LAVIAVCSVGTASSSARTRVRRPPGWGRRPAAAPQRGPPPATRSPPLWVARCWPGEMLFPCPDRSPDTIASRGSARS